MSTGDESLILFAEPFIPVSPRSGSTERPNSRGQVSHTNQCNRHNLLTAQSDKSPRSGGWPNGLDFLAGGGAGRAKLLLSRIPALPPQITKRHTGFHWHSKLQSRYNHRGIPRPQTALRKRPACLPPSTATLLFNGRHSLSYRAVSWRCTSGPVLARWVWLRLLLLSPGTRNPGRHPPGPPTFLRVRGE